MGTQKSWVLKIFVIHTQKFIDTQILGHYSDFCNSEVMTSFPHNLVLDSHNLNLKTSITFL